MNIIFLFLCFVFVFSGCATHTARETRPQQPPRAVAQTASEKKTVTEGAATYQTKRDLDSYEGTLENTFLDSLQNLTKKDIWIDSGSGDALAPIAYLDEGGVAKVISVDARAPNNSDTLKALKKHKRQFKYKSGKYIQEYKTSDLPKAKLITDVLGATAYAGQLDEVLQVLLSLLDEGGRLYFQIDEDTVPSEVPSDIEHANNVLFRLVDGEKKAVPIADWYKSISGVKFYSGRCGDEGHESGYFERIKGPLVVPKLTIDKYIQDTPPQRFYIWN